MPNIPFKKKSIILLRGYPQPGLFDRLQKRKSKVVVMEGRPDISLCRQTCAELVERRMNPVVITDNMAGFLFSKGLVKEVLLAYHSSSHDGVLCPTGGLILAVLGKRHRIPVFSYPSARSDEITGRPKDIFYFEGERIAPSGIGAFVPLFEWIPRKYLRRIYER